jgi:DNA-binding MarR family transcriptional regulator
LLREIALVASADPGEAPVSAGVLAIVEDVSHHGPTSVGEVARRTRLAQSLVSKTVAEMRAAGIMTAESDQKDRRRVVIRLDPATRTGLFRARSARPIEPALRERLPDVSERELRQVLRALEELVDGLVSPRERVASSPRAAHRSA